VIKEKRKLFNDYRIKAKLNPAPTTFPLIICSLTFMQQIQKPENECTTDTRKAKGLTSNSNSDLLSFKRYKRAKKSSVSTSVSKRIRCGFPPSVHRLALASSRTLINTTTAKRYLRNIFSLFQSQSSKSLPPKNYRKYKLLHPFHTLKQEKQIHKNMIAKSTVLLLNIMEAVKQRGESTQKGDKDLKV
jgi:uncharacterized protein YktA (UPF0223 family)